MSLSAMRTCAVGATTWLAWGSRDFDGAYYCPKHAREMHAAHDPQRGGPTIRMISAARGGHDWIVVGRDGDQLTVRRLGFPDDPPVTTTVAATYPGTGTHINYSPGCDK